MQPQGAAFTQPQLYCLRNQILALRKMNNGETLSPQELEGVNPAPLGAAGRPRPRPRLWPLQPPDWLQLEDDVEVLGWEAWSQWAPDGLDAIIRRPDPFMLPKVVGDHIRLWFCGAEISRDSYIRVRLEHESDVVYTVSERLF